MGGIKELRATGKASDAVAGLLGVSLRLPSALVLSVQYGTITGVTPTMTTTTPDEFDAVRTIVNTLEAFGPDDQNRILRWAAEKLGLSQTQRSVAPTIAPATLGPQPESPRATDIKSFVALKKPKNDSQFAAVVAYYYRFESPEKKESITQADLLDACRKTNYKRPPAPNQTLRNALNAGLLDKAERGAFSVNSVGENLVAVTLPGDGVSPAHEAPARRPRKKHSRNAKKSTQKKASSKK